MKTDDSSWNTEFTDIKKQLQKAFTVLGQCHTALKALDNDCTSHLRKVTNLTEQFQCSSKVNQATLPMSAEFPDLQRKLLYKIGTEINGETCHLKAQVSKLQESSGSLTKQFEKCMQCYRRSTVAEELPKIMRKTSLYPSVSEMLEWLQSCESCLRESYLCKRYLLDTFTPDDDNTEDGAFEKAWSAGDTQLTAQLEECMAYTNHFMELKMS